MTQPETHLLRAVQLAATQHDARVFRNNVGQATTATGHVIRYGLAVGSSDLIGWHPLLIRPHHVGQRLAVFTSLEIKTPTGRVTAAQTAWLAAVQAAGGLAAVVRHPDDLATLFATQEGR